MKEIKVGESMIKLLHLKIMVSSVVLLMGIQEVKLFILDIGSSY